MSYWPEYVRRIRRPLVAPGTPLRFHGGENIPPPAAPPVEAKSEKVQVVAAPADSQDDGMPVIELKPTTPAAPISEPITETPAVMSISPASSEEPKTDIAKPARNRGRQNESAAAKRVAKTTAANAKADRKHSRQSLLASKAASSTKKTKARARGNRLLNGDHSKISAPKTRAA